MSTDTEIETAPQPTRHEQRASEFRLQASRARANALAAVLPRVRETQDRAAATWQALAEIEDEIAAGAAARISAVRPKEPADT